MGKRWSLPPRSKEHRRKLSEAARIRFADPAYRLAHAEARKGQIVTIEQRRKIKDSFARAWADPERREQIRSAKIRAAQCIKTPTYPERRMAAKMDAEGTVYEFQVRIGPYLVDFLVPPATVIEVDGARWHNAERDAIRDEWLHSNGYEVVRIPASDLVIGEGKTDLRRAPTICSNCHRAYSPMRKSLCAICYNYSQKHGSSRPTAENGEVYPQKRSLNRDKTFCLNGHPFDEKNTYTSKDGRRSCRPCMAARAKARRTAGDPESEAQR